jgi:hypothetical protein
MLKLAHLVGLMLLFGGVCGTLLVSFTATDPPRRGALVVTRLSYAGGMLLLIVTGVVGVFALGFSREDFPLWAKLKFGVVVLFIPGILLANRKGTPPWIMIPVFVVLGAAAAALAVFKPM